MLSDVLNERTGPWTRRGIIGAAGALLSRPAAAQHPTAGDLVKAIIAKESRRTNPDYIAYLPGHWDGSTNDGHNEHFLVFDGPDGSFMTVWTQSPGTRGRGQNNRIMFSRSDDDGVTWKPPMRVAGPANMDDPQPMASWGFPMVSKSGRIYVIWNQNNGDKAWI